MKVAYDPILHRPGAPQVQKLFGCEEEAAYYFLADTWLHEPTEEMGAVEVDDEQLLSLRERTIEALQEREEEEGKVNRPVSSNLPVRS